MCTVAHFCILALTFYSLLSLHWNLHKLFSMWAHGTCSMVSVKHLSSVVALEVDLGLLTHRHILLGQVYSWADFGFGST